jgi:hypothetical protein
MPRQVTRAERCLRRPDRPGLSPTQRRRSPWYECGTGGWCHVRETGSEEILFGRDNPPSASTSESVAQHPYSYLVHDKPQPLINT